MNSFTAEPAAEIRVAGCRRGAPAPLHSIMRPVQQSEAPDASRREWEPRDRQIERLERENTRLHEDLTRTERDRDRWKRRRGLLQQQLDAALRSGFLQAAPFAKDRRQGCGERPGGCAGALYGRQRPAQVDETHQAPVPTRCPDCGAAVKVDCGTMQYLPVVRPLGRRFNIKVGHYSHCRRQVQSRHALQTSYAPAAASMQLGPEVVALVVHLHTQLGTPLAMVTDLPATRFGVHVTL